MESSTSSPPAAAAVVTDGSTAPIENTTSVPAVSTSTPAAADETPKSGSPSVVVPIARVWDELHLGQEPRATVEDVSELDNAGVTGFASYAIARADEWAALFKSIPTDSKVRKDALQAALKIKTAGKKLTALVATTKSEPMADTKDLASVTTARTPEADGESASAVTIPQSAGPATEISSRDNNLIECQRYFRDELHGLLEISFPVDQSVVTADFADVEAFNTALGRLYLASDLVGSLANLFEAAGVDPAATAEPEATGEIPPELMKMLEKQMAERSSAATEESPRRMAAVAEWKKSVGRGSCVVGKELYEALCYRIAMLQFMYIKHLVDKVSPAATESGLPDPESIPPALTLELVDDAIRRYENMLWAQGPVGSTTDDPAVWRPASDGPHTDETARLFHHAIYSSNNLRALKHQAELTYWRWKYLARGRSDTVLAAVVNRKFTHIVRHIIPGRGWLADEEYNRVCELESSLNTSAFSAGLDKKPLILLQAEKDSKKAEQRALKDGGSGSRSVVGAGDAHASKNQSTLPENGVNAGESGVSGSGRKSNNSSKKKKGKKKK